MASRSGGHEFFGTFLNKGYKFLLTGTFLNKGYKFLLTCIDVFSKLARVVPLENKTESLVSGFQLILDLGRSPEKLQIEKGTEFLNRNFQSLLTGVVISSDCVRIQFLFQCHNFNVTDLLLKRL